MPNLKRQFANVPTTSGSPMVNPEGQADVYWLSAQREILTTSLEGSSETAATPHMDSVSATTKPVKKARVARSGKGKSRAA